MKCKNCVNLECDWCDMKADSPDPDIERDCHWFAQKTNADRIRSMTDEELAELFWIRADCELCPNKEPYCSDDCKKHWLDWLKKEATE